MAVRKAIVKTGQTLQDIAIQYCGNLGALSELATMNNLALTQEIAAGQELLLPAVVDKRVEVVFRAGGYFPAAGNNFNQDLEGVGFWGIEFDFIVS